MFFVSAHLYGLCKSYCSIWGSSPSFIPQRIRESLAKYDAVESVISLFISYQIYNEYEEPYNTDPWGMPFLT